MIISLDDDIIAKASYTNEQILLGLFIREGGDYRKVIGEMLDRKDIREIDGSYQVTGRFSETLDIILSKSSRLKPKESRVDRLVKELRAIFPAGKKEVGYGANYYWRGNTAEITHKLRKFFLLYGEHWDDDDILEAAKRYVDNFNGDYTYMRLLKYFILKEDSGKGELVSELLSYLENKDDKVMSSEWTSTMI